MTTSPRLISVIATIAALVTGCQTMSGIKDYKTTGLTNLYGTEAEAKILKANGRCETLIQEANLGSLDSKMVYLKGAIPTREMISLNEGPTDDEIKALQRLEGVRQTCRSLRNQAGYTTTAGEDIMEARLSKLRYGLYKGEIPYAVYNYGVAQAMREEMQYQAMSDQAYAQGKEIGRQRALAQMEQSLQQMRYQAQINNLQNQINTFNSGFKGTWNCTASSVVAGWATVTCY